MRTTILLSILVAIIGGSLFPTRAAEPALDKRIHVDGVLDKPGDWSPDRLKKDLAADLKVIEFTSHDQKHRANCVSLLSLLKASCAHTELKMDPAADPKTKNYPLRLIVQVKGSDGYTASFSLAELLPEVGNREVWLALDMDDQPLPEKEQPIRLIVPADVKPARWVHTVTSISVIDNTSATTQPAK